MKYIFSFVFFILSLNIFGQNCTILSKANNITPDRLCSPVTANWIVTYTGVTNEGTDVAIHFDWDNGNIVTIPAIETTPGVFQSTASNTYTSAGNTCNYHPQATLIVNGVLCTSSTQEQIVTVWDNDDHNGGHMHINPIVYPICFGNGTDVRFQDLTLFNCVPPQERDNPNVNTRWIQWIYGTDNTMTGFPLIIGGQERTYPYHSSIIILPGPVTGSGVYSDIIQVPDDKMIGQYFQVTLRNWNYCNPYDDPNIPGLPIDSENGDFLPVITTAIILIVPYPDATINPVNRLCSNDPSILLTARTSGGTWSGIGVVGNGFSPIISGPGDHIIKYDVTDANGCSSSDTVMIHVYSSPDATITPVPTLCSTDAITTLVAHDPGGVWTGNGMTGNVFDPAIAGLGNHVITYSITSTNGCTDTDQTIVTVATPDATINPIDTLCVNGPVVTLTAHDLGGVWSGVGVTGNTFNPHIAGIGNHTITYNIINPDCQDVDETIITVVPIPVVIINSVGTVFVNSPPITVNATPSRGIFSGTGMSGNIFNPGVAGVGNHLIKYVTAPDKFGCINLDSIYINVIMPPIPNAYFMPDTTGCSPLTVTFRNLSTYAETYFWNFGDGSYSREVNPVHTFYAPGNYIVRLTVSNISGQSFYNRRITVFQTPKASFNVFPTEVINNSQIVMFYNYSYFGVMYLWNFGDGQTSTDKDPWHKYENEGVYNVTLTVTSADGCIDSAHYTSPIKVEYREGFLKFPNAFMWNKRGPTGGYWVDGTFDDFVFKPYYENIVTYHLEIFNRWGVLIYTSDDLHKGWDGYYNEGTLAPQGAYVWKVSGQYADGKFYNMVGDVTFLH
jgi:PKD repeat protein